MPSIDPLLAIFVLIVAVFMPYVAVKSGAKLKRGAALPPARLIHLQTLIMLLVLTAFGVFVARRVGIVLFPPVRVDAVRWGVGAAFVAGMLGFGAARWRWRADWERRRLVGLLPREAGGWVMWTALSLAAGVGEEIIFRGVLHAAFEYWFGTMLGGSGAAGGSGVHSAAWWIATVLSAAAFGLGHGVQGWSAAAVTFVMAMVLQGFALWSESLYLPMAQHFTYDLLAGAMYVRLARRDGLIAGAEGPGSPSADRRAESRGL